MTSRTESCARRASAEWYTCLMSSRSRIEATVRERSQTDPEFRARLLADPRSALAAHLDAEVPESLVVRVIEEGVDEVVLVLPEPRAAVVDLADSDLSPQSAAGWSTTGSCGWTCGNTACSGC